MSIDTIVKGSTNTSWYKAESLLPSSWALPPSEETRIIKSNIRLKVLDSPAASWVVTAETAAVVIVNPEYLGPGKLSKQEFVAMILHELGHLLNQPNRHYSPDAVYSSVDAKNWDEFWADDYARHCGKSADLQSCLSTLAIIDKTRFENDGTQRRIERIQGKEPQLLNLWEAG